MTTSLKYFYDYLYNMDVHIATQILKQNYIYKIITISFKLTIIIKNI